MFENAKEWLWKVAAVKILKRVIVLFAARVGAIGLDRYGLSLEIDPDALTLALFGGFETLRNWLKMKGAKWL